MDYLTAQIDLQAALQGRDLIPAELRNSIFQTPGNTNLWTVRLPNGREYQFPSAQAALRFYQGNAGVPPWGDIKRVPGNKWSAKMPDGTTRTFSTEQEAIEAWRRARGGR